MNLTLKYTLFAIIATAANILAQDVSIHLYASQYAITISVCIGTGIGLIVKYFLDKRFIFRFRPQNMAHDGRTFILYTLTGIATTAVFWGTEFAFHAIYGTKNARYLGAVIGLSIGYLIKYRMDRKLVFQQ